MLPTPTPPDSMGATLAKLALERAREAGLDHAPTRALVHMALTALDRPNKKGQEPDRYFGGRVDLARALGYGAADPDDADTTAAHSAVERAIDALTLCALIVTTPARNSWRSEYDLSPLRQSYAGKRFKDLSAERGERRKASHQHTAQRAPEHTAQRAPNPADERGSNPTDHRRPIRAGLTRGADEDTPMRSVSPQRTAHLDQKSSE